MSDADTITGLSGENDSVREIIEWFLTYYEPSDEGMPAHTLERIDLQFNGDADEADMLRAYEILHDRSACWAPRPDQRRRPPTTCGARLVACALPAGHEGPHSRVDRPPPFIALKGAPPYHGSAYVRADRIESVCARTAVTGPGTRVTGTSVSTFNGAKFFTEETPDEVFAKMADALHANNPTGTDEPLHYPTSDAHSRTLCGLSLTEKFTQTFFTTNPDTVTCRDCAGVIWQRRNER